MKNKLKETFEKISPVSDKPQYIEALSIFKENEWFSPTNKNDERYSKCEYLYTCGLIAKKILPIWNNGSFIGNKIMFMYNLNLKYLSLQS